MLKDVRFEEDGHKYFLGDTEYISVTTVIEEFGLSSVAGIPEHILERAGRFGSAVHKLTRLYDEGNLMKYDNQLQPWLNSWVEFRSEYTDLDNIILDIKTGVKQPSHAIQTGAYSILSEENATKGNDLNLMERPLVSKIWRFAGTPDRVYSSNGKIKHRWCIYLGEDKYKIVKHKEKSDISLFKSMMQLYSWKKINKLC